MFKLEKSITSTELGSPDYFKAQENIIKRKPLVKMNYDLWYRCFVKELKKLSHLEGHLLELGSGGSYLKDFIPELITSDIVAGKADKVIDARSIPFPDNSIKALFLTHSFHHIPDVSLFFKEVNRVLVKGGCVFFIEVTSTPLSKCIFTIVGDEPIDTKARSWDFKQDNAMMDANQALSWIIFERDIKKFNGLFPDLIVKEKHYLPWCSYLVSGGVTRQEFIPNALSFIPQLIDFLTRPLYRFFSLHWYIKLQKRE
jgi:SAM-dependent methyltransferase